MFWINCNYFCWCRKPWRLEGRRSSVTSWRVRKRGKQPCAVGRLLYTFLPVQKYVRLSASQQPSKANHINSVHTALHQRCGVTGDDAHYDAASSIFTQLCDCMFPLGRSYAQLHCILQWVLLPAQCQRWPVPDLHSRYTSFGLKTGSGSSKQWSVLYLLSGCIPSNTLCYDAF